MAFAVEKSQVMSKTTKSFLALQISLRLFVIVVTLAAAGIMMSAKQTTTVFTVTEEARYTLDPAFKFFAYENIIAGVFSFMTLILTFAFAVMSLNPATCYFYVFLVDMMITLVMTAGIGAAIAIGLEGKFGNGYAAWMAICNYTPRFCNHATVSLILSFAGLFFYIILTIISANKSRHVHVGQRYDA